MTTLTKNIREIWGKTIEAKVGSVVWPDNWFGAEQLIESDWDAAQFRIKLGSNGPIKSLAVNVEITGRTIQYHNLAYWIRIKIEFVGDGEPSQIYRGWLKVD